ncbi:hypothetical protein ES319_D08G280300v1 [Gossypium barbadense]|uniref:NAD(P)-binding domain-containing protein n=1 Tax=Gossypium barbadense TaxID=3634 RepID=A0A5J5QR77_GOSBA|nr:hypothetical protein ES319_D08G280300v1 [Gossypium barbadense]
MATYTPKNILITGAASFIASHVANRLIRNYLSYKIVFVKGDISSAGLVNYLLVAESIDTIMHFAAQTHVNNLFENNFEFTKNNIYGTHVLLEACKVTGQIRRFIHVSTDEVYGETDEDVIVGNHEASQLLPTNPYSATKAGAEMLVMAYSRSYGLPGITTRGNNVYGPNQFLEKLILKFILLAMRGKTLPIHRDGSNVRSYLHCEDVAETFEVILHKGEVGHVYNVGTKKEMGGIDVAKDICKLFSMDPETNIQYFLDNQKLKNLGRSERTIWEEGLKKTIAWYTKNPEYFISPLKTSFKFLIYGRTGWIGGILDQLCKKQCIPFEYGRGRLKNRASLMADIQNIKPTHVFNIRVRGVTFNAAGVTSRPNIDWCESHRTKTIRTNVVGTLTLVDVCRQHELLMMNFATGCIFEYNAAHPQGSGIGFKEEGKPNFIGSFYSKTKAMVEELLREYDNVCTLKVRMPISSDLNSPRNFITKISCYNKVVNIPNGMTILDELLPMSIEMAKRNLRGIWNFTNPGVWINFTLEEQAKVIVAPRSNNKMDASMLKKEFPELLPIKESLIKYVFEPNKRT